MREHAGIALTLAIARYLTDHPEAEGRVGGWVDDGVRTWRDRGTEAIAAEAARRLHALQAWRERAGPELWEPRRPEWLHAQLTLQSASSGAFGSAAGPLTDFLRDAGAEVDELELH